MILQKQVTLDEAMLDGFKTFRNGCNFKIVFKQDGSHWLECGCYCLVNLLNGNERLLLNFLEMPMQDGKEYPQRRIDGLVKQETIKELLKREPCKRCGGFQFQQLTPG